MEMSKMEKLQANAKAYYANSKDKGRMQFHMSWAKQVWPYTLEKFKDDAEFGPKLVAVKNSLELMDEPTGMEILGRVGWPLFDKLDEEGKRNRELIGPVIEAWAKELA